MPTVDHLTSDQLEAINFHILSVTLPLLYDNGGNTPVVQGAGTLFEIESRYFIVTALHVLKTDPQDLFSPFLNLGNFAFPHAIREKARIYTLGKINVHSAPPEENIDIAVIELLTDDVIACLKTHWRFLTLNDVAKSSNSGQFIVAGPPATYAQIANNQNEVIQELLVLYSEQLQHTPAVSIPSPHGWDQFYVLHPTCEGLRTKPTVLRVPPVSQTQFSTPSLRGISGTSIWAYDDTDENPLWVPSMRLRVVGVEFSQSPARTWFRGIAWDAVKAVLHDPDLGLSPPP